MHRIRSNDDELAGKVDKSTVSISQLFVRSGWWSITSKLAIFSKYLIYLGATILSIILQGSASETTLLCLLAAKSRSIKRIKKLHPEMSESEISGKLIAYSSGKHKRLYRLNK